MGVTVFLDSRDAVLLVMWYPVCYHVVSAESHRCSIRNLSCVVVCYFMIMNFVNNNRGHLKYNDQKWRRMRVPAKSVLWYIFVLQSGL